MEAALCETRKTVGAVGKVADGAAQRRVGGKIEGGGAVIEDQDARAAHQCAGNREALPLAAGRDCGRPCSRAKSRPPSLLSTSSCAWGSGQCFPNFVVGSIRFAPLQIFPHRALEELRLLRHNADFTAELRGGILAHIHAVHRTSPPVAS